MNSEQADRNDQYLGAQIRLDAMRAWRRPSPRLRIRVVKDQQGAPPSPVPLAAEPLPEEALAA